MNYKTNYILKHLYSIYKVLVSNRYTIGLFEFDEAVLHQGFAPNVHWIKDNNTHGWYADPFILSVNETSIVLLVEEFKYKLKRGIISKLVVDKKDYSIKEVTPLIDKGYHMSFPAYFRENGYVYIYPESMGGGKSCLYRYNEATGWIEEEGLLNPNRIADPAIIQLPNGTEILSCTTYPRTNGNVLDIYPLYKGNAPSPLTPIKEIVFERKIARNAGLPFCVKGRCYRPAQDSTNYYGECTEIQEIIYNGEEIDFKTCNRLYSTNKDYPDAMHTFNVYENKWVVVDARKRRFPLIAKLLGK